MKKKNIKDHMKKYDEDLIVGADKWFEELNDEDDGEMIGRKITSYIYIKICKNLMCLRIHLIMK